VEGIASTQLNVRTEPSTASEVLGILPANTVLQIIGKDPGENWWQILYPQGGQGADGKGWVTAQYVTTAGKPEVPVIGGAGPNPNTGNAAIVQQKINIRSGPGTGFNSLGTLNPQDVVRLTGKDANGTWLQIDFPAGPAGKGWVNAAFVQAQDVDKLPIVSDSGSTVGTGTPVDTALPPTPTVAPAPMDNDSAQAPAVNIAFSATGTRSIQYTSDVSTPTGDTNDWIQFTPFTQSMQVDLICLGNASILIEVLQNNQSLQNLTCGINQLLSTNTGIPYLVHIQATANPAFNYTQYTLTITSLP
jgi:N-acetylmuramoyl-L-alanine amidase